jgi:hypothetical protein
MELNLRQLQKIQRDTGFNRDFLEKAFHMTRILAWIFKSKRIGSDFALKGGTALNFIFLDIPRLSVDLDLNFIGALDKKHMLAKREDIPDEIAALADALGYKMAKKPGSYIIERYVLRYKRLSGLPDSVRLEINFLERIPFREVKRKNFNPIFEAEKFKVNTYTIEEIAAMKTKALVERLYSRDIFDMYEISKLQLDNRNLRKLIILYIIMARKEVHIDEIISKIKRCSNKEILKGVGPFLRRGQKEDLNPALIKKSIEEFYRQVMVLDSSDYEFIESLKSGKVDLKKLFGGENFNPQAEKHPGLVWALNLK